jgi:large subunit ribosomal protein L30
MAAPKAKKKAAGKKSAAAGTIQIKWVRSAIAAPQKHKLVVKGLGFTRLNQVIERQDTPSIRGMVAAVPHLVKIVESPGA